MDKQGDIQTPGESLQARRLAQDLRERGRLGTRVEIQASPFRVAADEISNAIITGPRRYMLRRRRIEQGLDQLVEATTAAWQTLAQEYAQRPAEFAAAWRRQLLATDVVTLNRLIDAHNRYYPIEANLPMDPRTSNYVTLDGRDYRFPVVDLAWLSERFPADLSLALTSAER